MDAQSPYHASNHRSTIVVALPFNQSQFDLVYREPLARVVALFEWRLQTSGDIPDWESHHATTVDFVSTLDQLPPIVH